MDWRKSLNTKLKYQTFIYTKKMIDMEYYKLEIELTIIGAIILGIITFVLLYDLL